MKLQYYLEQFDELKALYQLVKHEFSTKTLIHHNWNHIQRDLARAIIIGEVEEVNMKILLAGVLLHDIGRLHPEFGDDHYEVGAKIAPKFLKDAGFTDGEVNAVIHCVKSHGLRGLEKPRSIEAKVGYDVDVLSCSVGYVGVARVFDFFMREVNLGIKEMMEIPSGKRGKRQNFYTETVRRIGGRGFQKAKRFWQELLLELEEEEQRVKEVIPDYKED